HIGPNAVGDDAAIIESKRIGDRAALQIALERERGFHLGSAVQEGVVPLVQRDAAEMLLRQAVGLAIAPRHHCEIGRLPRITIWLFEYGLGGIEAVVAVGASRP